MKQARAIVPQAAFFVGSALALAQVALSTQKSSSFRFAFAAFTSGERINRNESDLVWQNFQVSKRTDVSWSLAHGAGTALEVSPTLRARCQGLIRFQKERTCRTFQDTHVGIQSSDRLKLSPWWKHCFFFCFVSSHWSFSLLRRSRNFDRFQLSPIFCASVKPLWQKGHSSHSTRHSC